MIRGHVPAIAVDLTPRRPDDFASSRATRQQKQFQHAGHRLWAFPQLGVEARQLPPRHRRSLLNNSGHARKHTQHVVTWIVAVEPPRIDGHGVFDHLLDAPQHSPSGLVDGRPDRFHHLQHVGLCQSARGLVHQLGRDPLHRLPPIPRMQVSPLTAHVGDERLHVVAERDCLVRDCRASQCAPGIDSAIFRFTPKRPAAKSISGMSQGSVPMPCTARPGAGRDKHL